MNPQIQDFNNIQRGDYIRVPGEFITVPKTTLEKILDKYYPEIKKETSIKYIKWLNGKNPEKDRILPGDIILVPIIY